jgi:hypothetical protein
MLCRVTYIHTHMHEHSDMERDQLPLFAKDIVTWIRGLAPCTHTATLVTRIGGGVFAPGT